MTNPSDDSYDTSILDSAAIRKYAHEVAARTLASTTSTANTGSTSNAGWLLGWMVEEGARDTTHGNLKWANGYIYVLRVDGELLYSPCEVGGQSVDTDDPIGSGTYHLRPLSEGNMTDLDRPNIADYKIVSATREELGRNFQITVDARGLGLLNALRKLDDRPYVAQRMYGAKRSDSTAEVPPQQRNRSAAGSRTVGERVADAKLVFTLYALLAGAIWLMSTLFIISSNADTGIAPISFSVIQQIAIYWLVGAVVAASIYCGLGARPRTYESIIRPIFGAIVGTVVGLILSVREAAKVNIHQSLVEGGLAQQNYIWLITPACFVLGGMVQGLLYYSINRRSNR
ncbi:hypothetical protein [Nocardia salmonicida]|uniref:hypothetical protein n=1 Tax=Nocardia salmonicida TaxID=53431 RepID=UPI00362734E9